MNDKLIWYFEVEDRTIGPISSERLLAKLAAGEIHSQQIVWRQTPMKKIYVRAERALASFAASDEALCERT